jgi:putative flippase GtrA
MRKLFTNQFFSYVFVGGIGTVAHTGTLWLLTEYAGINPLVSSTVGFFISLFISYYLNSTLTFKKGFHIKFFLKYFIVSSFGLVVNLFILFTVQHVLLMNYMLGQLVAIVVVPILNFALNKYWAFNSKAKLKENSGGIL